MIVITADVGGSKTTVAITNDGERIGHGRGPGSAVRPGRALVTATTVADLIRATMAQASLLRADAIVVGAAGAGRPADAEEIRTALARERIAASVTVVTDVGLAFEALGSDVGVVLVAGTGSVAIGRTAEGRMVRRGGFGWQMGDEGAGYWIGRSALIATGLAEDGRGPTTALTAALLRATGAPDFRELVGWSTVATPREVAQLTRAVAATARDGDGVAAGILEAAACALAGLINSLRPDFASGAIPLGMTGGILVTEGLLGPRVASLIEPPFVPLATPVDPLLGGPRLAAAATR
ncbi:MAG: N-acetylglucosamine kinase [Gemmatimonadales bacterium]